MRIRTKLLILLLLIAVTPLVIASLFNMVTARKLGRRLADDRRRILTDDAHELLTFIVESHGQVLERDTRALEYAVKLQALEVERRLADSGPAPRPVYFDADYSKNPPKRQPPGTRLSEIHARLNDQGEREPIPVSYEEQVFFLVKGIEATSVEQDISRLSTMPRAYQYIHRLNPDLMYWQYTSLETGFHTSYPGHGGYPDDYDPRTREWYQQARDAGQTIWVMLPEVSTRTVALTVASPVRRPNGAFAGVTAIDVPLTSLFAGVELPARWAEAADALLVGPGERIGGEPGTAFVVARQGYDPGKNVTDWRQPHESEQFVADDPQVIAEILGDAGAGRPGVRGVMIDGEPFLVAYGTGSFFPLIKVPEQVLLADIEQARQRVLTETRARQAVTLTVLLIMIASVIFIALRASRVVTRPARQLARAAQRLSEGDYDARVEVRSGDELAKLGAIFNQVGPQLREREHIKHALAVAMEVQRNLLPAETPKIADLDLAGHSTYCDETGGDYYDYLELVNLDEHSVTVVVGDVMGHGVAAAMLMATARGILKSRCTTAGSLAELLTHLNRLLVDDTGGVRFMTMLIMTLDTRSQTLRWASAGHDPPFVYDPENDTFAALDGAGLPLGIMEDEIYEEYHHDGIGPGTLVFAATDGVWEMNGAGDHAEQMFGKERIKALLRTHHALSAESISAKLREQLVDFRGGSSQDDDVTFVVVKTRDARS